MPSQPPSSLRHCNGNLLCCIDVETTGADPMIHEIIQVAFLPLNSNYTPMKITPFYLNIRPMDIGTIDFRSVKVHKQTVVEMMAYAIQPEIAADMFMDWFYKLDLPLGKKLMPLWSGGSFDKGFLVQWLGNELYNDCIHYHERDTQSLALAINDRFDLNAESPPFGRIGLASLADYFGIINESAHDALADCATTAKVYRAMLAMFQPNL